MGLTRRPDITTLRIVRYDPKTGRPVAYGKYAFAEGDGDRPFRWYDDAIPYDFPEFADATSRTGGRIIRRPPTRGGHFLMRSEIGGPGNWLGSTIKMVNKLGIFGFIKIDLAAKTAILMSTESGFD